MSGITLEDIANDGVKDAETFEPVEMESQEVEVQSNRMSELFQRILTAETGEGEISSYVDHPMNFNQSMGMAQILRGVTGIIGNLKLAIIDIGFGVLRFSKERAKNNDVSIGGSFNP